MTTIAAKVNSRLLGKASRMFTGTLSGRIIEILQNARRAGAKHVVITNDGGMVHVRDDGRGVEDFQALLDLGGSNWNKKTEASEDPAGVGLFCLAPRLLGIRSAGRRVSIGGKGWTGAPLEILPDPKGLQAIGSIAKGAGTELSFPDEAWTEGIVGPLAVFSGFAVTVDGQACPKEEFITGEAAYYSELGCRIQVIAELPVLHRAAAPDRTSGGSSLVNFHGQVIHLECRTISNHQVCFLIDMTGEPTGLRLMLPARTCMVENEALAQLKAALEKEAFRYVQRLGHHKLPYREYLRARALGIELGEATPAYEIGLLHDDMNPQPVEVAMPEGHKLSQCYRLADSLEGDQSDEANAHLLAALGKLKTPLIPVVIRNEYDGYSWAKLPTIDKVEVNAGKVLQKDSVWSGDLYCVETLAITCHCSDGKVFTSPVPMAVKPLAADEKAQWSCEDVYVTLRARETLTDEQIWFHLGGSSDDGDTYDTQEYDFAKQLGEFWEQLQGPMETVRRRLLEAANRLPKGWQKVTIQADGGIVVMGEQGREQVLVPAHAAS